MNITERFLNYVSYDTQSEEESTAVPSTAKQLVLGKAIAEELKAIGLSDAHMDEKGYVYATLPANTDEKTKTIGLIAHMDTAPAAPGKDVKPRIVHYEGGDITLNDTVSLKAAEHTCLQRYIGQDLIVTDGTTLLGADDKAGAAEIVATVEYLTAHPGIKHGPVRIGFTPDEEIGRGADYFDVKGFGADYAYTVDGGALGGIEYECFNAASCKITFHGLSTHTGDAKNKMINAIRIASEFVSRLPADEIPERTEGYEGFFHLDHMEGDVTEAHLAMIIRDHDWDKFQLRKKFLEDLTEEFKQIYGQGTLETVIKDSYYNMRNKIEPVMFIVEKAKDSMRKCGVEPVITAIRGGTDGARLSFEGLPCPNLSTGGENFHGIHEFIPVRSMEKMVEILTDIITNA